MKKEAFYDDHKEGWEFQTRQRPNYERFENPSYYSQARQRPNYERFENPSDYSQARQMPTETIEIPPAVKSFFNFMNVASNKDSGLEDNPFREYPAELLQRKLLMPINLDGSQAQLPWAATTVGSAVGARVGRKGYNIISDAIKGQAGIISDLSSEIQQITQEIASQLGDPAYQYIGNRIQGILKQTYPQIYQNKKI